MIKRIIAIAAFTGLAGFSSLASAHAIAGASSPVTNSAEFAWRISGGGAVVVSRGFWDYTTDASSCAEPDCLVAACDFRDRGYVAGDKAKVRFVGHFKKGWGKSNAVAKLQRKGRWHHHRGRDSGRGCRGGCDTAEVPEPGVLLLFGIGLLGIGLVWRYRRSKTR